VDPEVNRVHEDFAKVDVGKNFGKKGLEPYLPLTQELGVPVAENPFFGEFWPRNWLR